MKKLSLTLALCGALYASDKPSSASIDNVDKLNVTIGEIVKKSFPDHSEDLLIKKMNSLAGTALESTQLFSAESAAQNLFISRNVNKLVIYVMDGHFDRIKHESLSTKETTIDFDAYLEYIDSLSKHAKNNLKLLPQIGKAWTKEEWDTKVASAKPVKAIPITKEELKAILSAEQLEHLDKDILRSTIALDIIQRSFPNRNIFEKITEEMFEEQSYLENNIIFCSQDIKQLIETKSPDLKDIERLFPIKDRCELMIYILDAHVERMERNQEKMTRVEEELEYAKEVVCQIRENLKALNDLK